jgi:hypothetical protein
MRTSIRILLITILTLTVCSLPSVFQLRQHQVRQEVKKKIKAGVPSSELHAVSFVNKSEIQWVKQDREFRLGEHLWDVVEERLVGDSVYFQCIRDDEERLLFVNLTGMQNDDLTHSQTGLVSQTCLWFSLKYIPNSLLHYTIDQRMTESKVLDLNTYVLAITDPTNDTPPPQC